MVISIEVDDLSGPDVGALLAEHLAEMRATSPPESVHALDVHGLRVPEVTFWAVRDAGVLVGCGALKDLGDGTVELKSMRTATGHQGRGIATLLLRRLLAEARRRSARAVLLETGTEDHFAPARRLYARHGFVECPPFADYVLDPHSVFLRLDLDRPRCEDAPMADQPWPTKGPASYFPSIEKTYGQPIEHWMDVITALGDRKHMEKVAHLKSEHGLGHGHANALVAWHSRPDA